MIFGKLQAAIMLQRYFFRGLQSFLNRIPMKTKLVNYNKKKRQINVIYEFKSTACLGCALGWIFCTFTVDGFCATSRNIKLWGKQTINKDGICATASTHHSFFTLPASRRWAGVLFVTVHHASVPVPRSPFCHAEVGVGLTLTAVTVSGLMKSSLRQPGVTCDAAQPCRRHFCRISSCAALSYRPAVRHQWHFLRFSHFCHFSSLCKYKK